MIESNCEAGELEDESYEDKERRISYCSGILNSILAGRQWCSEAFIAKLPPLEREVLMLLVDERLQEMTTGVWNKVRKVYGAVCGGDKHHTKEVATLKSLMEMFCP